MNRGEHEYKHWKREPWVWLLIAIPASAVVMGVVMLTLAIQSYSGLVVDDYYQKGKQINRVIARDRLAYELGLSAALDLGGDGEVAVHFDPSVVVIPGDRIELSLVHATRPGFDRSLILERSDTRRLAGALRLPGEGRWNLYLQTADWRLTGSLQHPQQHAARLQPNYRPPDHDAR